MKQILIAIICLILLGCVSQSPQHTSSAPNSIADARIALGLAYLKQGDTVKAKFNLDKAQRAAPTYIETDIALSYYFTQVKEFAKAAQRYQQAIKRHPHHGGLLHNYATFLCQRHHYNKAQHYFSLAIQQPDYPNIAASYENSAMCYWQNKQYQPALTMIELAKNHAPQRSRIWQLHIQFLRAMGKPLEANQLEKQYRIMHNMN
ncbi:tetratricopeptide repeat protein [Vibrio nitrifigilis]|uniref:Tetratricopeptide repeat protein n=1 Tax=Vibrio nitrifigilis TaxID=2789781 RepID=A0ABS0GCQ0_9VIBR|nr:tetratricopeptide repeat protein [Vibrio nitrifigilis]MBF9000187.1 tetratricopeptide repeat protein [Vibrio nitrifigilis]